MAAARLIHLASYKIRLPRILCVMPLVLLAESVVPSGIARSEGRERPRCAFPVQSHVSRGDHRMRRLSTSETRAVKATEKMQAAAIAA